MEGLTNRSCLFERSLKFHLNGLRRGIWRTGKYAAASGSLPWKLHAAALGELHGFPGHIKIGCRNEATKPGMLQVRSGDWALILEQRLRFGGGARERQESSCEENA